MSVSSKGRNLCLGEAFDHVLLFDDPARTVFEELVCGDLPGRADIGLDYFDGSIKRITAWVVRTRNAQKLFLAALLQLSGRLRELEDAGDYTARLAKFEESKTLPLGAVWEEHCRRQNVPADPESLAKVNRYEGEVLYSCR